MFPPVAERTPVSPFLASAGLRLAPIGWEPSYHSIDIVTDKSGRGNQPELRPLGESDMRNGWAAVGVGTVGMSKARWEMERRSQRRIVAR